MWARISALLVAVLASFVLTGAGQVGERMSGPESAETARAVAVLTGLEEGPLEDAVPDGFAEAMGYRPRIVRGAEPGEDRVLRPDGDCSGGFGATSYDFEDACKTHDYGYELLRYAAMQDGELGPWARAAIDDLLHSDLRRRCAAVDGGGTCRAVADIAFAAVKANSWRQGQGVPGSEDPGPYIASGALILAAVVVPSVVARIAHAHRRRSSSASNDQTTPSAVSCHVPTPVADDGRMPAGQGGMAWTAAR